MPHAEDAESGERLVQTNVLWKRRNVYEMETGKRIGGVSAEKEYEEDDGGCPDGRHADS